MPYCPFDIEPSWHSALAAEWQEPYIAKLAAFVAAERIGKTPIYPPPELIFNSLWQTPYEEVKAVIVGQDPYHGPGQAHGLSFSVPQRQAIPPSLKNIYKEIHTDLGLSTPPHGCLLSWAKQGVLLLNSCLTVRQGLPLSHQGMGWERLTDAILRAIVKRDKPAVFLLWGKFAQQKGRFVSSHPLFCALTSAHPSPLSANNGFFGCRHFSKANDFLSKQGCSPIDWSLGSMQQ